MVLLMQKQDDKELGYQQEENIIERLDFLKTLH
jgi:hypothetical protein